ncbi:hypothetical protein [Nocardioides sp. B-3]|nr:hypothetical protein [Nocardioides sp. B-3]UUZ57796.1 hypothetical protein LP418_15450 [Nocardioides sp. B-3]
MGKLAIELVMGADTSYVEWQTNGDGYVARMECPIVRRDSVAPPPEQP